MAIPGKRLPNRPSAAQVTMIHTLAHKLGWSDNRYRDELAHRYHVSSCIKLTRRQTRDFIEHLQSSLAAAYPTQRTVAAKAAVASADAELAATPERLTQKQIDCIVGLWWQVSRGQTLLEKRDSLRAFIKRQTGCDSIRFVPRSQAPSIICALKTMRTQQEQEKEKANG